MMHLKLLPYTIKKQPITIYAIHHVPLNRCINYNNTLHDIMKVFWKTESIGLITSNLHYRGVFITCIIHSANQSLCPYFQLNKLIGKASQELLHKREIIISIFSLSPSSLWELVPAAVLVLHSSAWNKDLLYGYTSIVALDVRLDE